MFFKKEDKVSAEDEDMDLVTVYQTIWRICKLPRKHCSLSEYMYTHLLHRHSDVQSLLLMHFLCKIGFQANEAVTSLKMVEKGLGKEDLALAVMIDFPCQIVGGYLTEKWSKGDKPLRPWLLAYGVRLSFAALWALVVHSFPHPPISTSFFSLLVCMTVLQGFSMFVTSSPLVSHVWLTVSLFHPLVRFNSWASVHSTRESLTLSSAVLT